MRSPLLLALFLLAACEPKKADPRYEISEQSVKDTGTGLTWQRGHGPSAPLPNQVEYCAGLTLDGYSGFRVPSIVELRTISKRVRVYDALRQKPGIDRVAFPGTPPVLFWALPDPENAKPGVKGWVLDFSDGTSNNLVQTGEGYAVRCVR